MLAKRLLSFSDRGCMGRGLREGVWEIALAWVIGGGGGEGWT